MYPPVPIVPTTLISIPIHSWGFPYSWGSPYTHGDSHTNGKPAEKARFETLPWLHTTSEGSWSCNRGPACINANGLGKQSPRPADADATVLKRRIHDATGCTHRIAQTFVQPVVTTSWTNVYTIEPAEQPAVSCKHHSISRGSVPSPGDTVTPVL